MKKISKYLSILWLLFILISCTKTSKSDRIIIDRIEYFYKLKNEINAYDWPDFSDKNYDLSLIYYSYSNCYISNPPDKFIHVFKPRFLYKNDRFNVYKAVLLDSIKFHMATEITFGDSTNDYNYNVPFMNCSSPEITIKTVRDVYTTELWATMAMHEYFHGFQFKHKNFLDFYVKNINVSADSLKDLYYNNDWFKKSVEKENELLLIAIDLDSNDKIKHIIDNYFGLRDSRLNKTKEQLKSDIKLIEETYETMEGTARYIEFCLYRKFSTLQPDNKLIKSDSLFQSYKYFNDYSITKDKWLYSTNRAYYYSTGFNIARLLDKLNINYKARLFNDKFSISEILREITCPNTAYKP